MNENQEERLKELKQLQKIKDNELESIEITNRQAVELLREGKALQTRKEDLQARQKQLQIDHKFMANYIEKGLLQLEQDTKQRFTGRHKMPKRDSPGDPTNGLVPI